MKDLIIETLAKMYDAVIRGICIGIALAVAWPIATLIIKKTPALLKSTGAW